MARKRTRVPASGAGQPVTAGKPLTDDWASWLSLNRERGCDLDTLFREAARQGFDPDAIAARLGHRPLGDTAPPLGDPFWQRSARAPLTQPDHLPRAWRVDADLVQLYEIPDLLSPAECVRAIETIDRALSRSTVTVGPQDYRTSRTCHLDQVEPELAAELDGRLAALVGVHPTLAEPLQGQRYDPGEYFKAHTDWFQPGSQEYAAHASPGGQRTWTVMVYLNSTRGGGETRFPRIGRSFTPLPGLALAWNNLHADGEPDHLTLHEALPVREGRKYVLTKWFRAASGRMPGPLED